MMQTYMDFRTYKPISIEPKSPQPGGPVGAGGYISKVLILPALAVVKIVAVVLKVISSRSGSSTLFILTPLIVVVVCIVRWRPLQYLNKCEY